MKRLLVTLLLAALALTSLPLFAQDATEAPSGTYLGTWPYVLLPDHHFNGFNGTGGPNANLGAIYRSMVELTPAYYMWASGEYLPLLAESWGFTDDGTAYDMTLKSGAMWSDGSPITADDVITTFALGRIMNFTLFTYVDDVEKIDDLTVRFHFIDQPSLLAERLILKEYIVATSTYGELAAQALEVIASGVARDSEEWTAMRTAIVDFRPTTYVASGPYTYTLDAVGDAYMTLSWQPNSIYSDSVKFGEIRLWAGETDATAPLVLSGELAHSTNVYSPSTVDQFINEGIEVVTIPRAYGPALLFNHDVYPWNVTAVRQATALVIDRAQSAFLTNGVGAVPTVYMAGVLDDYVPVLLDEESIAQLDRYEFDPARAEALLTEAGFVRGSDGIWEDAEGVDIAGEYKFPAEFADFSAAAQDAINQMNAFGFNITARATPWQETAADIRAGNFQLSVWSWAQGSPFASRQFFGPIQRFNYVGLADGQVGMNFPMEFEWDGEMIDLNTMINEASNGLDVEEQRRRSGEVALIINQLMPFVPLNIILSVEPFNADLIGGTPAMDDPILLNPSGADHFVIYYLLTGVLFPPA